MVVALDPQTGHEMWKFDPQAGRTPRTFHAHRGVAYWQSEDGRDRRILYGTFEAGLASRLVALDARTGKPCPNFGDHGSVNLRQVRLRPEWPDVIYAVTSPPVIYKNLVIIGGGDPRISLREDPAVRFVLSTFGREGLFGHFIRFRDPENLAVPSGRAIPGKTEQAQMCGQS